MAKTLKRYIGLHHVVFFRACMEDPDELLTADLANRYLETGTNLHEANRVLRLVQESLVQVAKRQGRYGAARLLNLPRGRLRVSAPLDAEPAQAAAISFETFQAQYDPDGAFGYSELLEIYEAEHGNQQHSVAAEQTPERRRSERETKRALRLLEKKIRLINDLSLEIIREPQPEDWAIGWFAQKIADRLEAVGIKTLQDIIDYANFHGYRWWTTVKGVGKLTGDRIIQWLADQNFPQPPSEYALKPRRKLGKDAVIKAREAIKQSNAARAARKGTGERPQISAPGGELDAPLLPALRTAAIAGSLSETDRDVARVAFSGQTGRNRAPAERCRLDGVDTDMHALRAWLALHTGKTLTSYRKEIDRFALWAVYERSKCVSDLDTPDVAAYAAFLADPSPAEKWVADRRYERGHPGWRPFTRNSRTGRAGLSRRSVAYAIGVLSQACDWLVSQRYLDSNPFDGLPRMTTVVQKAELGTGKSLPKKAWEMLREATEALALANAGDVSYQRGLFALLLGFGTGLRISEIAAAKVGDLQELDVESGKNAWSLSVLGKGQKQRFVPIPSKVFSLLVTDLQARTYEFKTVLDLDPRVPLLARLAAYTGEGDETSMEALTVDGASDVYTQVFTRAADWVEERDPHIAARIRRTSPHHLRHTYASMGVKKMQLKHVQDNLGHASIATTSIYLHADKSERFEDTDQFFDKVV